jgi:hypothetical protein
MSSSEDDDVMPVRQAKERINLNIDHLSEEEFSARYRLTKEGYEYVHSGVGDLLQPVQMNNHALTSRERLLVTLR